MWSDLILKELPALLARDFSTVRAERISPWSIPAGSVIATVADVSVEQQKWIKRADTDHTCTFAVNHWDYFIFKYAKEE